MELIKIPSNLHTFRNNYFQAAWKYTDRRLKNDMNRWDKNRRVTSMKVFIFMVV